MGDEYSVRKIYPKTFDWMPLLSFDLQLAVWNHRGLHQ